MASCGSAVCSPLPSAWAARGEAIAPVSHASPDSERELGGVFGSDSTIGWTTTAESGLVELVRGPKCPIRVRVRFAFGLQLLTKSPQPTASDSEPQRLAWRHKTQARRGVPGATREIILCTRLTEQ